MSEMLIDIGTLRGLGTVLVMGAFCCVLCWTFSARRRDAFAEAAQLPFADEHADRPAFSAPRSTQQ